MRGLAKPRPLFNLDQLAANPGKPVIVFEGCRKADRAAKLFPDHICTAFTNGANAVGQSDLKPLHGRKVLIWRDGDEPGEAFAYSVGYALKGHCAEIHEVDFEAVYRVCAEDAGRPVPEGWDIVDALASKTDRDLIARTALEATRPLDLNVERPDGRSFIKIGNATLTPSGGLIMQVLKGKGANATLEDVWVSGAFEVLGLSRDAAGSDWGVFISWRDSDGSEHAECVQRSEIFGDQKKLATRLVAEGFPLAFGRERLLAQFLTMVRPRTRVTEVTSTGWHDIAREKVFVLPEKTFGSVKGETVRLKTDLTNSSYARSGTVADWRDNVGVLAQDQTLLMFAISAALAGVLLKLTGTDGGGFHFYGPSSKGKTTALRLAASTWGPGSTQGFIRSWRATANGLEAAAALASDTMLALDELSSADADEVSDAIYALSNGGGKSRALRSGEAQKTKNWRILLLSSGELPIEVKLTQGRRGSRPMAGQLARVVDIEADAGKSLGVFDSCGSFGDPSALARAIAAGTSRYYGTLGPAFIERVLAMGVERVSKRVRSEFIAPLVGSLGADVDGQVTRVAERFAVIAAAGEIAIEQRLLPWNRGDARSSAEWVFRRWLEKRGGASAPAEVRQAIETVRRFLQTHGESRFEPLDRFPLLEDDVAAPIVYNRAGWREGSGSGRKWYIPKESWVDICGDLDPALVAGALDDAGLLIRQSSSGRMITKKIRGSSMRVYGLTAAALGETAATIEEIAA